MLKKIRISIRTERYEVAASLFDLPDETNSGLPDGFLDVMPGDSMEAETVSEPENEEPVILEMTTEGTLHDNDGRIEIRYNESELSGMEGAKTLVTFYRADPLFLTMTRGGTVSTALTFEPGKRYICSYQTPIMPFEVCVHTISVKNTFDEDGQIKLDYVIEIRGAQAEHCRLTLQIRDNPDVP